MSASPEETWVALLEDNQLVELMFDRPDQGRIAGDVFVGTVEAVLPGIQAAFVDIGTEKAGFLHASDANPDDDGDPRDEGSRPEIQELVSRGQDVLVQVTKEPIGTKGPRVTRQVSLPGRFLVYMPYSSRIGVSRKIEDRDERKRLKDLAREILPENEGGLIVRTVGEELNRKTFQHDFQRLRQTWLKLKERSESVEAPAAVHREAKLISGVIRDLFSDKFDGLTVDSREIYDEIRDYLGAVDPELQERVKYHEGKLPLFDEFGIEEEIQKAFRKRVDLPSGGHIVIEPTEALVSIDVNTGRYTGKGKKKDPEEVILRTNIDAAREIAKQLRLRDIGGIIVADFIDMESQENRDRVFHELKSHLGRDRARTRAFTVSDLGLVEMTRQRVRPSLQQALTKLCEHCGGDGRVYTPHTIVRRVERSLMRAAAADQEKRVEIRVHPEVALELLESEPDFLGRVASKSGLKLSMMDDPLLREDAFRLLSGPAKTDVTDRYASR